MDQATWDAVDAYIEQVCVEEDDALHAATISSKEHGLPAISLTPAHGKMLHLFARMVGAKRILEVGTLGGYSGIWLARALPPDGRLTTLEIDPHHAEVARTNFERAGVMGRIELRVGPAIETLPTLEGPFDLTFIDADKQSTADYFVHAVRLSRPGSVIVVDNVVRGGAVADPKGDNEMVLGIRRFNDTLPTYTNVSATTVQTVGAKGYDGFTLAIVG